MPCQVIHTDNYVVAWLKDDKYLYFESQTYTEDDKRIVRLPNNSLVIYNATVEDSSDNYKCSILRNPDPIDLTHRLRVDENPRQESAPPQHSLKGIIRVKPSKKVEVKQGHSITLGCETDIQPPPEIKWFIENKKVDGYDPDVILDGNYITIQKVNESHSGLYQCLAEDGSEMPAMEAINVIVNYKPKIEVEKNIVYSGASIESEITCIVSAHPVELVTWYKDDKKLIQKKGSMMYHKAIPKSNKTKHILKILHTSARDFGEYKCRAENAFGHDIKSVILTGVPSQAKIYGAKMTEDDAGIILQWRLESYSPIDEYKLQYRRKGDQKWIFIEPEVKDGKGNQFSVEYPILGLQPGSYEAILKARNAFGWSLDSEPHTFSGDYPPDLALKENSATVRSPGTFLALILVVLSCAFTSLKLFT
ncbi:Opioid-binding protein/cell adhesion molecule like protein [Cyphomyrmex costatus]|uniref:Opioid-binding protein/cell adhesion molecule like protein n=2 Tax=Cyphomyrmex costatus TaxID=456900 RepID=A0A151I6Y3_9HYME|nr:Opioid-binding protein/cell adhesion molecule like protein [Cyphomyrmex costatus]